MLFHLVPHASNERIGIYMSVESTLRLARLLELFEVTLSTGQGRDATQNKPVAHDNARLFE